MKSDLLAYFTDHLIILFNSLFQELIHITYEFVFGIQNQSLFEAMQHSQYMYSLTSCLNVQFSVQCDTSLQRTLA